MSDVATYLAFAEEIAREAGKATLQYFQTGIAAERKADATPVTVADRKAEQLIRQAIQDRYPEHALFGEEFGAHAGDRHRWIIDPIDGTRSFVRGVPLFAVLIALEIDGTVQAGVAHFPALGETVTAARGLGCFWNGKKAQASTVGSLDRALVAHADAASFAHLGKGDAWERLQHATEYRAGWCDAYGYLLVATGRADVMIDPIMSPWDCGPFAVILPEAGAYFGDWRGNATIYGGEALGCPFQLLPAVLQTLAPG